MILHIIQHLILFIPTWVEAYGDRKGDSHSNDNDFIVRCILVFASATIISFWRVSEADANPRLLPYLVDCLVMSFCYFAGSFQYVVNWYERDLTKKKWYNHLNAKSIPDRWTWYRNTPWRIRIILHALIIVAGLFYYYL